ncbi:hypothetical protein [Gottschalkia acidurici]|uniref:hypothetical protein n=1 Tax=Clostridium acidurici TaxID=1556 RepID=UPI0002D5D056|nr:hypothetical protein [Gottschalkia acidurici]
MNKKNKIINLFMIAITITLLISISGCQQKQKKINQVKKENKVPQKLGSILGDIEKVEKGIKGIQKESEKISGNRN